MSTIDRLNGSPGSVAIKAPVRVAGAPVARNL